MATARDAIESALREIGVLAEGETASSASASDGLTRLNLFLNTLEAERLGIYTVTRSTWTISANDGNYSIGASGDVNITRPVYVESIGFIDTSTDPDTEYPLHRFTEREWQNVTLKAQTATFPSSYYYNPTFSSSQATVDFWPVPTSSDLSGVIYHWTAVSQISALDTTISLPPGYEEMLITNLAILLCPTYGRQPHPILERRAQQTLGIVKRANIRDQNMSFEATASFPAHDGAGYDIRQN